MRPYNWSYTQFSQFNQDDSLLLASGVFLGPHNSSSGEIAVISLDNFALLSRVRNKPYDVFGCWLTDTSLISGNLHRIGDITSCSVLWLNNAFQVRAGGPCGLLAAPPQPVPTAAFPPPGRGVGERERGEAAFQDPESQRQHHPHRHGGRLQPF